MHRKRGEARGSDAVIVNYPSAEFDDAVAAVCHGSLSDEQAHALNCLLRSDARARDEYILRLEVHSRLASDPDIFPAAKPDEEAAFASSRGLNVPSDLSAPTPRRRRKPVLGLAMVLAVCVAILAGAWWGWQRDRRKGTTSKAVAMLNRTVDARWSPGIEAPRLGAPLDAGWLRLNSGLVQVVFYSGARVVVEGPAEFQIISPTEASCRMGRLTAEVPPQARGFQIATPQMSVTDLGTTFGLNVQQDATELHVFKGVVEFASADGAARETLKEGSGAVAEATRPPHLIAANTAGFGSLFGLHDRSAAAETSRYENWREASRRLNEDPSLFMHFDFEHGAPSDWRLRNVSGTNATVPDGTIVGCQWVQGRWPSKPALEFRGVSDRVRLSVPGEYQSLTLAAWVRVQGLDRQFNSLFMCDGFDAGTLHWLIREDGVLGLTVIGSTAANYQIVASPSVIGLDQFGMWLHVAVVLDGSERRVTHYLNGQKVAEKALKIAPPFRIGAAELGNWNARGVPGNDPFMIRNFSGTMDDFCLFNRALPDAEIRALYLSDRPPR